MTFETVSIGDVADVTKLAGFEFTKYIEYNETGEIIALRALNLRNGTLDLTDIKRIDRSVSEKLPRSKLYINDILLTYTGNGYGDCAIVEEDDKYHLAPNICKIAPNPEKINPYFLYSVIRSSYFYQQMKNYIGGSSQPTIPMKTIRVLQVPYPPIQTQNQIASILHGINSKVVVNTAINENLESQAQALFKAWFVDFEPFGGVMPEDWKVGMIKDIIELHDSKRIPLSGSEREKMDKIYPYYGATSCMDYVDNYIFDGKYLLLGEDGTVIDKNGYPILQYVEGKFWVNNHAHIITGKLGYTVEILYLLFKQTNVKHIVTGAVQPKISQANLKKVPVTIPNIKDLDAFNNIIQPIFAMIRKNRNENEKLALLRDILLPKLMNGEIDVSEVKI